MEIVSTFQMTRTNPAHIGSSPIQNGKMSAIGPVGKIESIGSVQPLHTTNVQKVQNQSSVSRPFESYLLDAMQFVNNKQISSSEIAEKFILDPDSVDVHEVTTAMAEASLSLNLAQKVIDGLVKDWNEISTTR